MSSIHVLSAPPVLAAAQIFKAPTELGLLGAGDVYYYHKVADNEAQLPKGVTGRPSLTGLIDLVLNDVKSLGLQDKLGCTQKRSATQRRPTLKFTTARMSRFPALQVNGLSSVAEDPNNVTPTERTAEREDRKLAMLRRMRPPPLKYAWAFYHDKHSETGSYEGRLSLIMENIVTLKPFWGVLNNFPIHQLKMKDSVHFFKRGIKPVWEDSRNINGGSWSFRVPKDKSEQFWQEVLMMAVGEQFAPALQPRDDICGVTLSARFNSDLITVWNRDGSNQKSIDNILATVLEKMSPELKPKKEDSYYYKKHSDHAGYEKSVAGAKEMAKQKLEAYEAAIVTEEEGNKALLKDAENEDLEA